MASVETKDLQHRYSQGHSCNHCQKIILPGTPQVIHLGYYDMDGSLDKVEFCERDLNCLDLSGRDLEVAANDGCEFARTLLRQTHDRLIRRLELKPRDVSLFAELKNRPHDYDDKDVTENAFIQIHELVPLSRLHSSKTKTLVGLDMNHTYFLADWHRQFPYHGCDLWADVQIYTGDPSPNYEHIATEPISQKTVKSIKSWVENCVDKQTDDHEVCSLSGSKFLPSRLIEIWPCGPDYHLRLVNRRFLESSEYLALSYCWGGDQQSALKLSNLEQYKDKIPWNNVPRTIQDAVVTTSKLGYQHLWVDSLCTMQDSEEDKAKELRQMSQIYSSLTVTIMARRAEKATDGFLQNRRLPSGTSVLRYRGQNGKLGRINLRFTSSAEKEEKTRLETRGWVMQEHLLSRRLLIIGTWQTTWHCRQGREKSSHQRDGFMPGKKSLSDPFNAGLGLQYDLAPVRSQFHKNNALDAIMHMTMNPGYQQWRPDEGDIVERWYRVIEAYTKRSLSSEMDRILAVSGIAERFGVLLGRYIAGCWEKDILTALVWWAADNERSRPSRYTGPSWSWTAVNSEIHFQTVSRPPPCQINVCQLYSYA